MKRIVLPLISSLVLISSWSFAQNDIDALRYSSTTFGGTARYMSMGGAFGSLGADFSSLSTNPAGIGLFTKSELTITPSFYIGSTKSTYNGIDAKDVQYNFNLSNAGFVLSSPTSSGTSVFKRFQFGFGVNRINNFNDRQLMEGYNSMNSITDTYVDFANGISYIDLEDDPNGNYAFDLSPAWYAYMIDTIAGSGGYEYYPAVPAGSNLYQRLEKNTWGSMNEMVLSFGTSVSDRLYLGATLGFPYIRYFEELSYTEIDKDGSIDDFSELRQYNKLTTTGSGFNFKFGMILKATDWLRLGGSVHTPTWYDNMSDSWYSEYSTQFDNGDSYFKRSPIGNYNYRLETPWRAMGSASLLFFRSWIISTEYEYIDYTSAKLRSPGYSFYDENRDIQNKYRPTHNFRLGTELRVDAMYYRLGAAYYMSPYNNDINNAERFYLTGGLGVRDKNFFLDIAYAHSMSNYNYYMYSSPNVVPEPVDNKSFTDNIVLTLGFRM
ncbi:MAG TPA: hypothetical protein P5514_08375 [Bacteroidales bacterium]|nr:hypothetical protein [Bacteroidales bacterium]HRX96945.1 hypothetical protein [Bacteroidales bacterium]